MSFTSTIHYVVLLISNKNLPKKKLNVGYIQHFVKKLGSVKILPDIKLICGTKKDGDCWIRLF